MATIDPKLEALKNQFIKSFEAVIDSMEKTTEAQEKQNKASDENTDEIEDNTKQMGLMGKALDKLESQAEDAASSVPGFSKALGAFGDKLSADTTKKLTIFAGSLGLAAASAKKWTDATQAAILAVPQLEDGQTTFLDAMFSTAGSVARSGLSIEELTGAMRQNRVAFKQNRDSIVDAIGENRFFAQTMGLSNEQLANLTARTSNFVGAQENLTLATRDYIFNLEEVAIQTGRQASEIESNRATAREGTANLVTFFSEAGAKMVQGAITTIDDQFGPGMSQAVNNILGDGSTIFEMANNAGDNLRSLALAANNSKSEQEALALAGRAQIAIRNRDEREVAAVAKETAALSARIAKEGISDRANLTKAGLAGVVAESARNKIIKENGKTEREAINALIQAQKNQADVIRAFTSGPMSEFANTMIRITGLLGNFGSELFAVAGIVIGLKNAFQLLKLVGLGGLIGPAGAFLLLGVAIFAVIRNFDDMMSAMKNFKQLSQDLASELFGEGLQDQKGQLRARKETREVAARSLRKRFGREPTEAEISELLDRIGAPKVESKTGFLEFGKTALSRGSETFGGPALFGKGEVLGGPGAKVIPPSSAATQITEPGTNKNAAKGVPTTPQPSSTFTPATTAIEAPTPILAELGEQVKKAKSMEDLLRLLNENSIVQTALLDVIARSSDPSSGDVRTALRRSGISLASLQGTR